jgi:hypothetical protein
MEWRRFNSHTIKRKSHKIGLVLGTITNTREHTRNTVEQLPK